MAVLLDNFLSASNEMKMDERAMEMQESKSQKHLKNPLDPLLLKLARDYTSDANLSEILQDLFKVRSLDLPASAAFKIVFQSSVAPQLVSVGGSIGPGQRWLRMAQLPRISSRDQKAG